MIQAKYVLILFLFFLPFSLSAKVSSQQEYIDSLIQVANKMPNDSDKVVLLERIGYFYISLNPEEGKKYTTKAYELAKELGYKNREAAAIALLAANYAANSEFDEAIKYNNKSIEIFQSIDNPKGVAGVKTNLSQVYTKLGDYAKALAFNFDALKMYEETQEYRNQGIVYENIANIYYELKELNKSKSYYLKALNLYNNHTTDVDVARALGNVARVYMEIPHYDTAMVYLERAYRINKKNNNKSGMLINLSNIGNVLSRKEQHQEALDYHYKALAIADELNLKNLIATNKGNIGSAYLKLYQQNEIKKTNLLEKAQNYLTYAIELCDEINYQTPKIGFLESLIESYVLQNNYQKAFELQQEKAAINDSIFSNSSKEKMANLEMQREIDLKDKSLQIKNKELEINKLKNQRKSLYYGLTIAGFLIIILVALFYFKRKVQKHNKIISEIKQIQSHEIRGPIATILGLLPIVKDTSKPKETQEKAIEGIEEMTNKLNDIVNQIINNTKS